ncbi:MAG: pyroglutamyl-peptidase I family protein [Planctomycetota bacterium]|jgi:pyroglutamyl-peptidase
MAQLLLTGFGPFLKVTDNPSGALARRFDGREAGELTVKGCELPVVFDEVEGALDAALAGLDDAPVGLLGLGVHRGGQWRVERHARRPLTATKPDVSGRVAAQARFAPGAAPLISTSFEVIGLAGALSTAGFPAHASGHAGGYVCDRTYHALLSRARALDVPALFVHVPPYDQVDLERHAAALEVVLAWLAPRWASAGAPRV